MQIKLKLDDYGFVKFKSKSEKNFQKFSSLFKIKMNHLSYFLQFLNEKLK